MDGCDMTNLPCGLTAAGPECEHGPPDLCLPQSEENVSLQLLEFKAHLLELIEELHIRRDAEERFEEQRNKIVLEKQELEWEKKSLQHQIESEKNHYAESLSKANKQNKYQVNSEQKDKDIQNLKEELKSLQLTKYNLEKKSSELEQKLTLQSRSKDSRLNQLSDVEKRFSALSRQCSMVKQAHGKLEQNVDEAMKLNKKLISTNETQLVTIASLNKEVEELRSKLVKTKMTSVISEKRTDHPSIKEQTVNQLQLRLNMECEMNRKYKNENKVLQAEKQEVLTSLQIAHQLLSKQTQTMSRLELDLEAQRKQYQSLEQDHKAMREKEKTAEDQIKQLMEECTVSKSSWDKEKADFLEQMKKEKQELTSVKEAFEELRQNHTELSSKAEEQAQLISELTINVKELDLVIPSNNTQDGIDSVSKIDVSGGHARRAQSSSASSGTSAHSVLLTSSQMSSTSDYLSSSSSTISICHKGKYSKVPLTITRAADLLSCGTTATSSGSHLQTECRALGEAHMDTTAQMDSRGSPSDAASLVSASSSALSRPQTKRTLSPDARGTPESEWGPGCSQDTEEQQSSFRTQISKIEQFLNTERLRLPKRRKTDN
uniref:Coiled-coil domain-containing protein 73 n=1 Tax=Knipowitschia caucasica TaxID=637954 RepID=A0AAV2KYY7_KNICA